MSPFDTGPPCCNEAVAIGVNQALDEVLGRARDDAAAHDLAQAFWEHFVSSDLAEGDATRRPAEEYLQTSERIFGQYIADRDRDAAGLELHLLAELFSAGTD